MKKILYIITCSFFPILVFANANSSSTKVNTLYSKILTCSKYRTLIDNPLMGGKISIKILGYSKNKCILHEDLPNNGKLDCNFGKNKLKSISKYMKDSIEGNTEVSISSNLSTTSVSYSNNNQTYINPMEEAMADGSCKISGYDTK